MRFCHWFLPPSCDFPLHCGASNLAPSCSNLPPAAWLLRGCDRICNLCYFCSSVSSLLSIMAMPSITNIAHGSAMPLPHILYLDESALWVFQPLADLVCLSFPFCSRPWLPSVLGTPLASDRYLPALVLVSPVPRPVIREALQSATLQRCESADDVLPENEVGAILIIPALQTGGFLRFLVFPDCLLCEAGYSVSVCGRERVCRCSRLSDAKSIGRARHCFWCLHRPCIGLPCLLSGWIE